MDSHLYWSLQSLVVPSAPPSPRRPLARPAHWPQCSGMANIHLSRSSISWHTFFYRIRGNLLVTQNNIFRLSIPWYTFLLPDPRHPPRRTEQFVPGAAHPGIHHFTGDFCNMLQFSILQLFFLIHFPFPIQTVPSMRDERVMTGYVFQ